MNQQNTSASLLHLFCKPAMSLPGEIRDPGKPDIVFSNYYPEVKANISFRSLQLNKDLPVIHEWVNKEYAHEYWQMSGRYSQLYAIYQCMELNPYAHSFIGMLNGDMICQFDVYSIIADELKEHIAAEPHDCGFHLLMAPNEKPVSGLTSCVIRAFLDYYFSFSEAQRMYAEPDMNNFKSIKLLEKAGFKKVMEAEMSYKTAHIYKLSRLCDKV